MKPQEKLRVRWIPEKGQWRWLNHVYKDCPECGKEALITPVGKRCQPCRRKRWDRRRKVAGGAHARVRKAIEKGLLPILDGSISCIDCGVPAVYYDHRSYAKPLEVDPVCARCNILRGPAIELVNFDAPFFTGSP